MADYVRDDDGIVHLVNPMEGSGSFTYCSRAWDGDGYEDEEVFYGVRHSGPSTCAECKDAVDRVRESIRGARWRLRP